MRLHIACLSLMAIIVALVLLRHHDAHEETQTNNSGSGVFNSASPASRHTQTSSTTTAGVGSVVMVRPGKWICGSTKESLGEMTKWAVRGDTAEMLRTMRRTRSFMLTPDGFQVKILDSSFPARKVRVTGWLDPDDGRIHAYPEEARIGRECWVPFEAVTR
jgi:hypothetical protein